MGSKHTPEPWDDDTHIRREGYYIMTSVDFQRSKDCVNALVGIPNPAEFVAAANELSETLKSIIKHVEDNKAERVGSQCTLCHSYRTKAHEAITRTEKAFGLNSEKDIANSNLITAAPDLLEAAEHAAMEWRLHGSLTDSCRVLEAAIAKARGGS